MTSSPYAKIIKLRSGTYVPGLGMVSIPTYIKRHRATEAWVIDYKKFPHLGRNYFSDEGYGGIGNALKAAIRVLAEASETKLRVGKSLRRQEMPYKVTLLDAPGVFYTVSTIKGVRTHQFRIHDPCTGRMPTVYIGTDNTYLDRWDEALRRALYKRHDFERQHTIKNYWKSLEELPEPMPSRKQKKRSNKHVSA